MSKRVAKLVLSMAVLAGSLGVGLSPGAALVPNPCKSPCCDASCTTYRPCQYINHSCVCSLGCVPFTPY
jgi:hypothetical protein